MAKSEIMIDNEKTRVTRWSFEPGEDTGEHIHEYDYVVVPLLDGCLLYTSPSPRDLLGSRMPSSA